MVNLVSKRVVWEDCDVDTLFRIGFSDELPKFPAQLSDLGHDFLEKFYIIFIPQLHHRSIPRSVLNCFNFSDDDDEETELNPNFAPKNSVSAHDRIRKLASNRGLVWESEDWMDVWTWICDRAKATVANCRGDEGEGINSAYSNFIGKIEESEKTLSKKFKKKLNGAGQCRYGNLSYPPAPFNFLNGTEMGIILIKRGRVKMRATRPKPVPLPSLHLCHQ
ncbi:hypothetical protein PVL29_000583 [Vitis rotundifolia]|uniref:Uncharacterized protein n=1 Tax=Vitis rotundifolia TaxID=103349 RepID=A0AA39AKF9_VITRO|nr:hypothetical protein PVL29_000583 [Vitis rotundifolia]